MGSERERERRERERCGGCVTVATAVIVGEQRRRAAEDGDDVGSGGRRRSTVADGSLCLGPTDLLIQGTSRLGVDFGCFGSRLVRVSGQIADFFGLGHLSGSGQTQLTSQSWSNLSFGSVSVRSDGSASVSVDSVKPSQLSQTWSTQRVDPVNSVNLFGVST
ncbi:hypothetical protein Hdeb2414_s0017g00513831 [Helianthus debilis subsp. tardiflorus]